MNIKSFFSKIKPSNVTTSNVSFQCPNCWGRQEWDNTYAAPTFDFKKGNAVDLKHRNGFIQRFVERFV